MKQSLMMLHKRWHFQWIKKARTHSLAGWRRHSSAGEEEAAQKVNKLEFVGQKRELPLLPLLVASFFFLFLGSKMCGFGEKTWNSDRVADAGVYVSAGSREPNAKQSDSDSVSGFAVISCNLNFAPPRRSSAARERESVFNFSVRTSYSSPARRILKLLFVKFCAILSPLRRCRSAFPHFYFHRSGENSSIANFCRDRALFFPICADGKSGTNGGFK